MRRRDFIKIMALLALAGVSGTACVAPEAEASLAQSSAPRETEPAAAPADLAELAKGNYAFAFDLYGVLRREQGNLFYSPYSISLALAMTYAGARGETEAQMARTLHYTLPQEQLHRAFNALDLQLAERGKEAKGQDGEPFRLKIANSVWGQKDHRFRDEYLAVLAANYGAGLRLVDFINAAEQVRQTINEWVEENTEGKITDLLAEGSIDSLTRLVLANAVYFNAAWKNPFESMATADRPFTLLDGSEVVVPTMRRTGSYAYARGQGYHALSVPYDGDEIDMILLLPDAGTFEAFESTLTAGEIAATLRGLAPKQVHLSLPKFTYESRFALAETLAALGMPDAFVAEKADFSGMTGERDLFIGEVSHKAFVAVNEKGTEAAAATAVEMRTTAAMEPPLEFTVDRPFVYLIRDVQTGTILFVGRMLNPKA